MDANPSASCISRFPPNSGRYDSAPRLKIVRRYTPTTTFETFPFPWQHDTRANTASGFADRGPGAEAIATAAKNASTELRENWLNPPNG